MSDPEGAGRRPSRPRHHKRPVGIVSAWIVRGLGVLGGVIVALINIFGGSPTTGNVNIGSTRQATPAASDTTASGTAAKATPGVVFRDDFCTTAGGWTLGTTQDRWHRRRLDTLSATRGPCREQAPARRNRVGQPGATLVIADHARIDRQLADETPVSHGLPLQVQMRDEARCHARFGDRSRPYSPRHRTPPESCGACSPDNPEGPRAEGMKIGASLSG